MKEYRRKRTYWFSRVFALLLVMALTAALLPAGVLAADGDGEKKPDSSTGIVKGYEWHRVNTQSDLPAKDTVCPVLILWKNNNTIYYATGGYSTQVKYDGKWDAVSSGNWTAGANGLPDPFSGELKDTMSFVTTDVMTSWQMWVTGKEDEDNKDCQRVRFYPNQYCLLTGYDDFDFPNKAVGETGSDDLWTIYTSEKGGKYGDNISEGRVKIFANVKWDDTGFMHKDDKLFGYCEDIWGYDTFIMYWGEERNITAITDDYSIAEGEVMNVDDGVMLMEGVTLTVEPGGMLSIEGTFYNNGTIVNRGTMIMQENACVCSMDAGSAAGRILCSGAEVSLKAFADQKIKVNHAQMFRLQALIDPYDGEIAMAKKAMAGAVDRLKEWIDEAQDVVDSLNEMKDQLDLKEYVYSDSKAMYDQLKKEYDGDKTSTKEELEEKKKDLDKRKSDLDQMEKEIVSMRAEYKEALEPYQCKLDEYYSYKAEYDKYDQQYKDAEATIERLRKENVKLGRVKDEWIQGDGNLLMLKGAKLALGDGDDSGFTIEHGANVTCHGYIFSPHQITLNNAKLEICEKGILYAGYHFASGVTGLASLKLNDDGTFPGLSMCKYYDGEMAGVMQTDDIVFEVDGKFVCSRDMEYSAVFRLGDESMYYYATWLPQFGNGEWDGKE